MLSREENTLLPSRPLNIAGQQAEIADRAELQLVSCNLEALEGGALCRDRRLRGVLAGRH